MRGRAALVLAALLAAGCVPLRVDIQEEGSGYAAVALGKDAEKCAEALTRTQDEARFFCEAHRQRVTLGRAANEPDGDGCRVRLPFWCTGATQ